MSIIKVNEIGTQSGTDVAITTGKTVSGTASQFKMTDLVAGDVVYASADDTLARLAKGTAAQVLTMNSGATLPEWAAVAATGTVNRPNFQVYSTSDFTWPSGSYAKIPFTTSVWDNDASFDTSTNYRFTVPSGKAGKYMFVNQFPTPSSGNGYYKALINGSSEVANFWWQHSTAYGGGKRISSVWTSALAVGDYLEWWVYSDSGAAQNGRSYLSGWRLDT